MANNSPLWFVIIVTCMVTWFMSTEFEDGNPMRIVFRELVADDDDDSAVEVVVDNSGKIDLVVIGFLCLH